jgi:AbrB family looped-hinge helix DNA binding protein
MNYINPASSATSCHAKLQDGGRVVIPADYRKALGFAPGETVVMRLEGDEIRIYSLQQAIKRAQQLVAKYDKHKGKSIVDELIVERRLEAKRELE